MSMTKSFAIDGLSAFPLTPLAQDQLAEDAFIGLIQRLVTAQVESITVLGSTGSYPYLSLPERAHVAQLAVTHAQHVPVFVGVGALRTSDVLRNVQAAEQVGAKAILLAPVSYQPLTGDEVFELFRTVTDQTELPVIVYDNPGTTHFTFTLELYERIAALPGIASIKIPAVPQDLSQARERVTHIRAVLPDHVTIGVSGDASAATGLLAGCDGWYSVIGGTLPALAHRITRTALAHDAATQAESNRLAPLWDLFHQYGSLRVVAAIAEHLQLAPPECLPLPLKGLTAEGRTQVAAVVQRLHLGQEKGE